MADTGQVSGWLLHKLGQRYSTSGSFIDDCYTGVVERHSSVVDNCRTDMADAVLKWVIITQM
jgi:hypothetical protein